MRKVNIAPDWYDLLTEEFDKPYFAHLMNFVDEQYATKTIYPPKELIFRAFDLCPFDTLRVVILGQDPYHGAGQANGLCFSVTDGEPFPPSLKNIFKVVAECGYTKNPTSGDLERWARQGVLLLNSTLTVEAGIANSHRQAKWTTFTDAVIRLINDRKKGVVFMLWGEPAKKKMCLIDTSKHKVLDSSHPSPLSAYREFIHCKHFSEANDHLNPPIEW